MDTCSHVSFYSSGYSTDFSKDSFWREETKMTRHGKPREWRIPLSVLGPARTQSEWNAACSKEEDPSYVSTKDERQRMTVCDVTGLLAVANARYVDVYHLDQLRASASTCLDEAAGVEQRDIYLPFATQITIADHVSGFTGDDNDDDVPLVVTCVHFVSPGILLVAAASAIDQDNSPSWLCGFRMYSRSVGRPVASLSSLIVHCAFVDRIPDVLAVTTVHQIASTAFVSAERGAVLLLIRMSPSLGLFQWKERFSDRSLSVAKLPRHSSANLTAIAATPDGRWAGLSAKDGVVFLLDLRGLWWNVEGRDTSSSPVGEGKRLELGLTTRLGLIDPRGQNAFDAARLTSHARLGGKIGAFGTVLRWWLPEVSRRKSKTPYLLVGQSDGAMTVMRLTKVMGETGTNNTLKVVETYPAIRSLKNDEIIGISRPQYRDAKHCFAFSTLTRKSWRQWEIGIQQYNEDEGRCKYVWPTLSESLGLSSLMLAQEQILGLADYNRSSSIDARLTRELTPHAFESTFDTLWDIMLTRSAIRVVGFSIEGSEQGSQQSGVAEEAKTLWNVNTRQVQQVDRDQVLDCIGVVDGETQRDKSSEVEIQSYEDSSNQAPEESPTVTIRDRYKLLPMPGISKHERNQFAQACDHERDCQNRERLTKDEYNKRLTAMAQRVDRLSSNMHTLRQSFQLFTEDVQRHFMFISDQLEQLQDTAESN